MQAIGVIINIFFPGIGSMIVGKVLTGIIQIILYLIGTLLTITAILSIIGIPLMVGVWIWAIVTAASAKPKPIEVIIRKEDSSN